MYQIDGSEFVANVVLMIGVVLLFLDVVMGEFEYSFYSKYFAGFVGGAGIGLVMAGVAFHNV